MSESPIRAKTGIKVIIVGAGFGGLTAAIECERQGHDVKLYESFPELKPLGDIITFGSNAGRIINRWSDGEVARRMKAVCIDLTNYGFRIHKWDSGEVVHKQPPGPANPETPFFNGHRAELHEMVFNYAKDELGIPISLGNRVIKYFENDEEAGIVLANGEKIVGDVVVGADGVKSKARELVLGFEDKPKSSGYAIWRAWFPNTGMMADPRTREFCENGDTFNGWIGPQAHFLLSTLKGGKDCCWAFTHKDEHNIDESWSFPGNPEDVYRALEGWDPIVKAIVEKTPSLVDWKLVIRDPLPRWVSETGRITLLGDAAHPFLPTSSQGGSQAIEDGATLAICLRRAGKSNVPAALRAYQDLRYDRVKAVQNTGVKVRDTWHNIDWEKVRENPKIIELPNEQWVTGFDSQAYAEEKFQEVFEKVTAVPITPLVESGQSFYIG